ncbi:PAS domain-containing sensor histidine kinase [candidate division WWE3 bacterium]|nr:PAS domain-containing sensor histidine kinase [candidate division WWE3 bacterium]
MIETAIIIILLVALSLSLLFLFLKKDVRVTILAKEVTQREGRLNAVMEGMLDGIVVIDDAFNIDYVNPATLSMLKIGQGGRISIFDIVGSIDRRYRLEESISEVFASGKSKSIGNIHFDGKLLKVVIFPISKAAPSKSIGIIFHDKTEEKQLQKLRDEFTAMVIHELRSPLTVISGTADLLFKKLGLLEKAQVDSFLVQIKNSAAELLKLVNDLLDASKLESGKFEISRGTNDINKLLEDETRYYLSLAKSKSTELKLDLDESLSPFGFDYAKIAQVMNNLLSNAIKYTSGGEIVIKSFRQEGEAIVSVSDTGVGVPDEEKPFIFDKFSQAHVAPTNNEKGTGLGLVISKGIIEAHGGSIWVEDNSPHGSKFVFKLPLGSV